MKYNKESAQKFSTVHGTQNTRILIYRDIKSLLNKYCSYGKALDFGCGPGISTRFLSELGFNVVGVDINKDMLLSAFQKPDGLPFAWIEHGKIPFEDNYFDLVFSGMVFLEEKNLNMMLVSIKEISRVLKPGGILLAVVASEHLHKHNWLNRTVINVENNQNLKTGDTYKTYSPNSGMEFTNFVYYENDYQNIFSLSNLSLLEKHYALGMDSDGINWDLEKTLPPFTHYVCKKNELP